MSAKSRNRWEKLMRDLQRKPTIVPDVALIVLTLLFALFVLFGFSILMRP